MNQVKQMQSTKYETLIHPKLQYEVFITDYGLKRRNLIRHPRVSKLQDFQAN